MKTTPKILFPFLAVLLSISACRGQSKTATEESDEMKREKDEFPMQHSDEEWQSLLDPEQYRILREKGTERPHTGKYNMHFEEGVYKCAACNSPLFSSDGKFESDCGWPSFDRALGDSTVVERPDHSHGMVRTEILCANCGGHLGHVFEDGPTETGLRYCINSAAMEFEDEDGDKQDSED